jgi:hypothetical protein
MENDHSNHHLTDLVTKTILTVIFLGGFLLFIIGGFVFGPGFDLFNISALDLVMLALATMRLGRMIAFDHIAEPLRAPFTKTVPDRNGAGSIVIPKGVGVRYSLGQLISCPICVGTWVAAVLVYFLYIIPGPTRVFIAMMAVVGLAELLHSATEALCWVGINARVMAGGQIQDRQKQNSGENKVPVE